MRYFNLYSKHLSRILKKKSIFFFQKKIGKGAYVWARVIVFTISILFYLHLPVLILLNLLTWFVYYSMCYFNQFLIILLTQIWINNNKKWRGQTPPYISSKNNINFNGQKKKFFFYSGNKTQKYYKIYSIKIIINKIN